MADYGFVPGFAEALGRSPVLGCLRTALDQSVEASWLTRRHRAQIALVVAQVSRCPYCLWASTCVARSAGLSGEDIALACAGTALDRGAAVIVRFAHRVANSGIPEASFHHGPSIVPLATPQIQAVLEAVALALLDNSFIAALAPRLQEART